MAIIGQILLRTGFACCLPNAFSWSLVQRLAACRADALHRRDYQRPNVRHLERHRPVQVPGQGRRCDQPREPCHPAADDHRIDLSITSGNPPVGNVGTLFNFAFTATGGSGTRTWSLAPFQFLPPGLSLDPNTGVLSGTPTAAGLVFVTVG